MNSDDSDDLIPWALVYSNDCALGKKGELHKKFISEDVARISCQKYYINGFFLSMPFDEYLKRDTNGN